VAKEARDIDAIFAEGSAIDQAIEKGRRRAALKHKRLGLPMALWIDGKVEWVDPALLLPKPARKK
jgi:hypothetical protein